MADLSTDRSTRLENLSLRNCGLDFTKGALVLLMILYHWSNFIWGPISRFNDILRFLTPSFIFLTGWIVSAYYPAKYGAANRRLHIRLVIRGLKLLGLFTLLNLFLLIAAQMSRAAAETVREFCIGEWFEIYVTGNSPRVAFRILVPISYLLLIAGVFRLAGANRLVLGVLAAAVFAAAQSLETLGHISQCATLLGFGLAGLCLGSFGQTSANKFAVNLWILVFCYSVYLAAMWTYGVTLFIQLVGTPLSLLLVYSVGRAVNSQIRLNAAVALIGQYSLMAYIGHIGILKLWLLPKLGWRDSNTMLILSLPLTFVLTAALVWVTDITRRRSTAADSLYKLTFA